MDASFSGSGRPLWSPSSINPPSGTISQVAIKIISKSKLDPKMQLMVQREISIMRMLSHPNIIRLYEVIESQTHIFLVMEYASGGEMMDFIVTHGKLRERDARRFFRQVVAAIDYCHALRVIHRDLKAENLLLDGQFHIKVIDFGLSNRWAPGELLQTFCGSPTYTAPELIRRQRYEGPEIDVWSLGVLLYVLVCGSLPFDGNSFQELFGKIIRGDYFVPDHISMELRDLIGRMLVVDPSQRATLDQVRTHRWILDESGNPVPKADPLGVGDGPSSESDLDEEILEECERIGYERDTVIRSVISNSYNDAAATYFLFLSRKKKEDELRAQRRQQLLEEQARGHHDRQHILAQSAMLSRAHDAAGHPVSAESTPSKQPVVPRIAAIASGSVHRESQHQQQVSNGSPASAPSSALKKYRRSDQRPIRRRDAAKSPKSPDVANRNASDDAPPQPNVPVGSRSPSASTDAPSAAATLASAAPPPAHLRHRRHRTVGTTAEITSAIQADQHAQHHDHHYSVDPAVRHAAAAQTPVPSGSPTILTPRSDSPESLSPRSPQKSPLGSPRSSVSVDTPVSSPAHDQATSKEVSPPSSEAGKKIVPKQPRRLSETSPQRRAVVIRDAKELQTQQEEPTDTVTGVGPTIRVSQPSPRVRGHRRSRPSSRDKGDPTMVQSPSSGSLSSSSGSESTTSSGTHKRIRSVDNDEPKPLRNSLKSPRSSTSKSKDKTKTDSVTSPKTPGGKTRTSLSVEADDDTDDWVFINSITPSSPGKLTPSSSTESAASSIRHSSEPAVAQQQSSSSSSSFSSKPDDTHAPRHSSVGAVGGQKSRTSVIDSLKRSITGLLQRKPEPRQARFPLTEASTSHRAPEEILEQLKSALTSLGIPFTLTSPFCLKCEMETLGFEVEICRLPLLHLNGVRFRRIYGDVWRYKEYGSEVLNKLNLKDEAGRPN